MKKIWEIIKAFFCAADKQLHIVVCYAIALTIFVFFASFNLNWLGFGLAIGITEGIAILKEIWDKKHPDKHDFEIADIVADNIGILLAIGAMLFYLLN